MRILGLDYGSKTVGVALSDATCLIAQPLETIERKQENKLRQTYARIEALVVEHDVDKMRTWTSKDDEQYGRTKSSGNERICGESGAQNRIADNI